MVDSLLTMSTQANARISELLAQLSSEVSNGDLLVVHGRIFEFSEEIHQRCRQIATTVPDLQNLMSTFTESVSGSVQQGLATNIFVLCLNFIEEMSIDRQILKNFCIGITFQQFSLIFFISN